MTQCLIVQPIHPSGVEILRQAGITARLASSEDMSVVEQEISDCVAVITRNAGLSKGAIEAGRRLLVIANHGIGTNKIDVDAASIQNIPIVFTPNANARSVAEQAIALALAVAKRICMCNQAVNKGNWDYRYEFGLQDLSNKTLGIVGFGTIGRLTAQIAAAGLNMKVMVYSPSVDPSIIRETGAQPAASLAELAEQADVLSLHRPSRPDTKHMINAAILAKMKRTAIIVNTARGDLVDEYALADAISNGRIAGAGLDVFEKEPLTPDNPLVGLDHVILTPHVGGSTVEALETTAVQCAQQIIQVLKDEQPDHLVRPAVWSTRRTSSMA